MIHKETRAEYEERRDIRIKERRKAWLKTHSEIANAATKKWRKEHPENVRAHSKKWYLAHKSESAEANKAWCRKARLEVIAHYGGKCVCCGETTIEFLALDHINGGGKQHRKMVGGNIYAWAKRNNCPNILQVLCHNCNLAKGFYGECPHQRNKKEK